MCVQRVDDSSNSAIHTTFSHFAAFFIVARTKRSIVERCIVFDAFALVTLVSKSTVCVKKKRHENYVNNFPLGTLVAIWGARRFPEITEAATHGSGAVSLAVPA